MRRNESLRGELALRIMVSSFIVIVFLGRIYGKRGKQVGG